MHPTVVLKIGGSLRGRTLDVVTAAVCKAQALSQRVLVVHGGGPAVSNALSERGIELPFQHGQRVTTNAAMAIVRDVLSKNINSALTAALRAAGVPAVGIHGEDGVLYAEPLPGCERTGRVTRVATERLSDVLASGQLPVLSPVSVNAAGDLFNVNADQAAAAVAGAVQASKLIFLTDVPGIYEDWDRKQRLTHCTVAELARLAKQGAFQGGMVPKVEAVLSAVRGGVSQVYVLDGRSRFTAEQALLHTRWDVWSDLNGTYIQGEEERPREAIG